MTPLFTKLNLGEHRGILVVNAPDSFDVELAKLDGVAIHRNTNKLKCVPFAIVFVQTLAAVEATAAWLPKATGDAVVWFAYPKGTSKNYTCEFNRDTGWATLGTAGFEPVRQVALDADWSALRFRRVEFIRKLTRSKSMALTEAGKTRTKTNR
jgi:hypothetical protein